MKVMSFWSPASPCTPKKEKQPHNFKEDDKDKVFETIEELRLRLFKQYEEAKLRKTKYISSNENLSQEEVRQKSLNGTRVTNRAQNTNISHDSSRTRGTAVACNTETNNPLKMKKKIRDRENEITSKIRFEKELSQKLSKFSVANLELFQTEKCVFSDLLLKESNLKDQHDSLKKSQDTLANRVGKEPKDSSFISLENSDVNPECSGIESSNVNPESSDLILENALLKYNENLIQTETDFTNVMEMLSNW
ncbi:uncharacterized protein LOC105848706 isoform X1 [Hydra vulgaris]|uniref:uncharacterized protein LOC105848706 isoform X1 n=2 Tax=Hydra vulgaris TaxID=6087 RepID=UPI001F5EA119|nr:uncharacterized protein LOC105848706 isoform X1 [Hydra vulgaris]